MLTRRFPILLLLWFSACILHAHEPFDCTSRMFVNGEHVQIEVTMGMDGVREVLPAAGFSEADIKNIVLMRTARDAVKLPVSFAARLFEVVDKADKLTAENVSAYSDGLEVVFTLVYPPSHTGELDVRATYFEAASILRAGALVAYDDHGNRLAGALLSRGKPTVQVSVPSQAHDLVAPVAQIAYDRVDTAKEATASTTAHSSDSLPFSEFFKLGVTHILTGFDHLLFLAALLIGVRNPVSMIGVVTCFTVAHSFTLALAALNLVMISPRVIEPLIAASIIVVCVENFVRKEAAADRFWLAGGFGLIHGFGFAGALWKSGLGEAGSSIVMPLFSFNLGIEAGQLAVVAVLLPLLLLMRRWHPFVCYGIPAATTAVGLVSGYWLLERIIMFK